MNIANKVTVARIFLIPVYMLLMYWNNPWGIYCAGVVFIIASATDTLDGYLARKNGIVTDFGKFLDPLADKLLVLTALILFAGSGRIPTWAVVIIMARELVITSLRTMAALRNKVLAADTYGKLKTITQLVAVSAIHFEQLLPFLIPIDNVLFYLSVVLTVFSGCNYLFKNRDVIDQ